MLTNEELKTFLDIKEKLGAECALELLVGRIRADISDQGLPIPCGFVAWATMYPMIIRKYSAIKKKDNV